MIVSSIVSFFYKTERSRLYFTHFPFIIHIHTHTTSTIESSWCDDFHQWYANFFILLLLLLAFKYPYTIFQLSKMLLRTWESLHCCCLNLHLLIGEKEMRLRNLKFQNDRHNACSFSVAFVNLFSPNRFEKKKKKKYQNGISREKLFCSFCLCILIGYQSIMTSASAHILYGLSHWLQIVMQWHRIFFVRFLRKIHWVDEVELFVQSKSRL